MSSFRVLTERCGGCGRRWLPSQDVKLRQAAREQMTEAMENIRHQLELLRSGPNMGGPSDDRSVIADLEAEFQALKEARANLGAEDR